MSRASPDAQPSAPTPLTPHPPAWQEVKGPGLFTATVGRKPSEAKSYLTDNNEVVELLSMLASSG